MGRTHDIILVSTSLLVFACLLSKAPAFPQKRDPLVFPGQSPYPSRGAEDYESWGHDFPHELPPPDYPFGDPNSPPVVKPPFRPSHPQNNPFGNPESMKPNFPPLSRPPPRPMNRPPPRPMNRPTPRPTFGPPPRPTRPETNPEDPFPPSSGQPNQPLRPVITPVGNPESATPSLSSSDESSTIQPSGGNGSPRPLETLAGCNCQAANQFNPVCGSDNRTYFNAQKLECFRDCQRTPDLVVAYDAQCFDKPVSEAIKT